MIVQLPLPIVKDEAGNHLEPVWVGLAFMRVVGGGIDRIISFQRYLELYYQVR